MPSASIEPPDPIEPPKPRLLLALDASSSRCSVAVWSQEPDTDDRPAGRILGSDDRAGPTGEAAHLPAMVAALLAGLRLGVRDLAGIAVSVGPGSFTGLRASLAFAQGLATGATIPVIGVTVAEAMAIAARAEDSAIRTLPLWCALDGRQGRLFLHRGGAPEDWAVAHLHEPPLPDGPVAVIGDAAETLGLALRARGRPAIVTSVRSCQARDVALAGAWRARGLLAPLAAMPLYIDPPRALLPKGGLRPPPLPAPACAS